MSIQETYNDEIDLSKVFRTILNGKIKIIIIVIISIFCAIGINIIQPTPTIKSITEIKPLTESQLNVFDLSNSLKIYSIDSSKLYNTYFDLLEKRTALISAIKKFEIISEENYENNEKYEEALLLASYDIEISYSSNNNAFPNQDAANKVSTIILKGSDKNKLFEMIKYIKDENNKLTIKKIEQEFESKILTLRKLDELDKKKILIRIQDKLDEYDVQMNKALQVLNFQIEDIDTAIENSIKDYKYKIVKKLAYLSEQAALARKLEIARGSDMITALGASSFGASSFGASAAGAASASGASSFGADKEDINYVKNNSTNSYYLRGYEAIEEEIQIIKKRKNIKNFVLNEELIKKKRNLEQNKNQQRKEKTKLYLGGILSLKNKLRDIDRNEILFLQAEELFKLNLTEFSDNLESVIFDPYSTKFKIQSNTSFSKLLVLAIILGLIIGLFYVIIEEKTKKVISNPK